MMRIAVVGASGFVGRALLLHLLDETNYHVTAISRNVMPLVHPDAATRLRWIPCDLHNLKELEEALAEQEAAVYLIHSMLPTARLNQGNFADFDLSLADNFARAAGMVGIRHVVYLSGLIPEGIQLSEHLQSRLEVEQVLRCYLPLVTSLRTGIIIGAAGSSFTILVNLVRRLPFMLCPKWTVNRCQVISLPDVVRTISRCLSEAPLQGQTWDLGAEPPISYLDMMKETARLLGLRRWFQTLPLMTVGLSRLWVSLVSGAPKNLVYPLVDSLKTSMLVRSTHRFPPSEPPFENFPEAVERLLLEMPKNEEQRPHAFTLRLFKGKQKYVRSIQRLPLPAGKDASWVAEEYLRYLPQLMPFLIRIVRQGSIVHMRLKLVEIDLLTLRYSPERSRQNRQVFYIVGGLLFSRGRLRARLEIRETLGGKACLAAVHDYRPALPWPIYRWSQAEVHRLFMKRLAAHLASERVV